jgi:hypothetical protein
LGISLLTDVLLLFVWQIPQNASIDALIWIIPMRPFVKNLILLFVQWIYIDRKIVEVQLRQFSWQTFVAPIIPALAVGLVGQIWFNSAYPLLVTYTGIYVTAAVTVVVAFIALLWVFFPLYTFFGGWDDYSIDLFHEAVEISGPSKFLFRPIDYANNLLRKSPFHNRYPIPYKEAHEEAIQIMKERFLKDRINQILLEKSK